MTKTKRGYKAVYLVNQTYHKKPNLNVVKVMLLEETWNNVVVNQYKGAVKKYWWTVIMEVYFGQKNVESTS